MVGQRLLNRRCTVQIRHLSTHPGEVRLGKSLSPIQAGREDRDPGFLLVPTPPNPRKASSQALGPWSKDFLEVMLQTESTEKDRGVREEPWAYGTRTGAIESRELGLEVVVPGRGGEGGELGVPSNGGLENEKDMGKSSQVNAECRESATGGIRGG